ncbi:MAG: DUF975 family protein [Firmicutes bacterium]|jgi:uncharacterized membrane protein|nr:DUF975 family protein [Bacillota bacterium]
MNNRIVLEPAFKIREMARRALADNWQKMFVGMFIYFFMSAGIMSLLNYFFSSVRRILLPTGVYMSVNVGYASWLYELAVSGALMYGLALFFLSFFRTKKIDCGTIFDGFSVFGKTFTLYLLFSVKIFLWSLLFGIPGIIAAFRYSQAFYLQADHIDWSATQCIEESKRLMVGNKGKLFYLNLTFIGWYFLASMADVIFEIFDFNGLFGILIGLITAIPVVVVDLYRAMSQTVFYELVTENLVVLENNR